MIHSFSCSNYYSIDKEIKVSFLAGEKSRMDDSYCYTKSKTKVSLVQALVGANASGKTNIMKTLPFIRWLVTHSFEQRPENLMPVMPFGSLGAGDEESKVEVVFELSSGIYTYSFSVSRKRIVSEDLYIKNKSAKKATKKRVFSRSWNDSLSSYDIIAPGIELNPAIKKSLRENASIIGTAARFNDEMALDIYKYWRGASTNIREHGFIFDHHPNPARMTTEALSYFERNQDMKLVAEKMLTKFDLGFDSFIVEKNDSDESTYSVLHKFQKREFALPLDYESSGSKQLFVLLKFILTALKNGSIAVIDEFDVNIHPHMVSELVDLFRDPDTNPNKAQIFLSTHSHSLLSELDKNQIHIVEKDEFGSTATWRVDSLKGPRADDNFFAKYAAGAYGGVPRIE